MYLNNKKLLTILNNGQKLVIKVKILEYIINLAFI